jgi:hypothetical protein
MFKEMPDGSLRYN